MIIIREREKYFSSREEYELYLEERRYNIISDLYHSGLKRTYQKNIGRLRSNIADSLSGKSLEQAEKSREALIKHLGGEKVKNEGVKKGVIKRAIKDGDTRISRTKLDGVGGSYTIGNKEARETMKTEAVKGELEAINKPKDYKKTMKSFDKDKHKHQIFVPKGSGVEMLAHEVGHIENKKSRGLRKKISDIANSSETRLQLNEDSNKLSWVGNHGKSGIGTALKDFGKSLIINQEEKNATKAGLKIMKEAGATKEELKKAKDHLKSGAKTYEHSGKANLFNTLKNTVQIPSRKSEPITVANNSTRKLKRRSIAKQNAEEKKWKEELEKMKKKEKE